MGTHELIKNVFVISLSIIYWTHYQPNLKPYYYTEVLIKVMTRKIFARRCNVHFLDKFTNRCNLTDD